MQQHFQRGDHVDLTFDTSVDDDRTDRCRVVDPDRDGVLVLDTVRTGGPGLHLHDDGSVTLFSHNAERGVDDFGRNGSVSRVD